MRVRELALASAPLIEIEGAASIAKVVLSNSTSRSRSSYYWFLDIRQGASWVEAGWGWVDCSAGIGVVPPGRCPLPRLSFSATHSGRHIGTLVPGPAVLTYELVHQRGEGAGTVARASVPVTLVAAGTAQVIVTPSQFTFFGAPGATVQLGAVVLPVGVPQQVTWTSTQPSVATVSSTGVVSLLAPGGTLVVATSTLDPTKQGSSLVSLNAPPVFGSGVNVSPGEWNALTGMSVRLAAQVVDGPLAVNWTAGNPSVATVNANGVVTAVGAGPLFVLATSAADATRSATVNGEVLDFDWRVPMAPTNVSTGATLPAANPLVVPLGVHACGPSTVLSHPYTFVDMQVRSGGGWVSVGSTSSISVIDQGATRCWVANITWTPGTSFGVGPQALRAMLYHSFGSAVYTQVNLNITLTNP